MNSVPGFDLHNLNMQGAARDVYRAGRGPAVIVMSEIPGITPAVAGFGQRLVDAGYTVFMPQLFGEPMRPPERGYALRVILKACISREFRVLAANRSSPIVDWLRALARHAHAECGGRGAADCTQRPRSCKRPTRRSTAKAHASLPCGSRKTRCVQRNDLSAFAVNSARRSRRSRSTRSMPTRADRNRRTAC